MFKSIISDEIESKIKREGDFLQLLSMENKLAVSFVNPFSYEILAKQKNTVDNLDVLFSDGALLCFLSNLQRKNKIDRVSFDFSSIADNVFYFAVKNNLKIALIGGNKVENAISKRNLQKKYPSLDVSYARDGYFSKNDFPLICNEIQNSNVHIVIAGMGTPLQDDFIVHCKLSSSKASLLFTCGGFITQTSLNTDYYHPLIKKLGLRWLQRAFLHKHVRSRLAKDYPLFVIRYLLSLLAKK